MNDDHDFEFDLAVSFAGEQRDYVRAVVQGLGDDIGVFMDENYEADLLGENLVEYFADLYQRRARYAAIFVSAAYAEKMWTVLERRSVMARALEQDTPYVLPIRMDDTQLPGLLPTVGYADARVKGLDGVIEILRQKLGTEAPATYCGRVPETQADIDLLLQLRPEWWEWWLYAGVLKVGISDLEEKYRDYEMGFARRTGEVHHGRDAFEFLRSAPTIASHLADSFNVVLSPEAQERAFGAPGTAGDPDRILHLARRLLDVYEGFMDEAVRLRGASLPVECHRAQRAAAKFGAQPVDRIRQFVEDFAATVESLPEVAEEGSEEEPIAITMTVAIQIDQQLLDDFIDGLQSYARSL